ncbi:N-6 DNA methylase [candidate division WOR-3 bacterium]|nr:N-6 DNA methylase [candidate division WOR-3 bacterium]
MSLSNYQRTADAYSLNRLWKFLNKWRGKIAFEKGKLITPDNVADLVGYITAKLEPQSILDPACGFGRFVAYFLKHQKKKPRIIKAVDINENCTKIVSEFLKGEKGLLIEAKDSLRRDAFSKNERYDVIMCDPPFGGRFVINNKVRNFELAFIEKCLTLLSTQGYLLIVVPDGVLFRSDKTSKSVRKRIINEFNLIAVFSLPVFAFAPYTSMKSSILLIKNEHPTDKPIIFGDFKEKDFNKESIWELIQQYKHPRPPLFLIERDEIQDEIQLHKFLPIEYRLGIEEPKYPLVKMSDIVELMQIEDAKKLSVDSLILRKVGNFKIVSKSHLDKISDKTIRNYSLLKLKKNINIDFLKLIFESDIFQKQIELFARGVTIKSVRNRDIEDIYVPLPPLKEQLEIADNYSKIKEVLVHTAILRDKILRNPFSKERLSDAELVKNLERFSSSAAEATVDVLPLSIASVLRQTKSSVSGKECLTYSVSLFETLLRFTVILLIMESYSKNLFEDVRKIVSEPFIVASTGTWFGAFKNITKEILDKYKNEKMFDSLVVKGVVANSGKMTKVIESAKIVSIRNEYLGHGAIGLSDSFYHQKNDEVKKVNVYLLNEIVDTLHGYEMIYVLNLKKKGSKWCAKIKRLMGDNRDLLAENIETPFALDTEKVMLVSRDYSECFTLDPLLHFGECSECHTENLFFYDKRHKDKVVYFNYLHVHRSYFDLLDEVKNLLPI